MSKRINIVLPDRTLAALDRVASKCNRSHFISRAVQHFIESQGKEILRERLMQEAIANAARDLKMAAEWFTLEEQAVKFATTKPGKKQLSSARSKST
jgi:CopG family transcriptional regulator/antitoxin EndoAI